MTEQETQLLVSNMDGHGDDTSKVITQCNCRSWNLMRRIL